jgi:ABC-type xylose transport system permease subunit
MPHLLAVIFDRNFFCHLAGCLTLAGLVAVFPILSRNELPVPATFTQYTTQQITGLLGSVIAIVVVILLRCCQRRALVTPAR